MSGRLYWLACCLTLACGGTDGAAVDEPGGGGVASSAGTAAQTAGSSQASAGAGGTGSAGGTVAAQAGADAEGGAVAQGGTPGAAGGQVGGTAGANGGTASNGGGGAASAGASTGGKGGTGSAGAPQGGTGGSPTDPLEPKPVPGCPGYVKVLVPQGTCVWLHGTFTHQTETCSLSNPTEGKCGTASAVDADTSTIVSAGAEITRFDFDQTGCPKQCN